MHPILLFALRRRFVGYVTNTRSAIILVLRILYVLILLINAAMIGWLIDVLATSDTMHIEPHQFIRSISAGFCGLWALVEFFPTYTQRSSLISGAFPVSFTNRWGLNLAYDATTATTVGTVMALCLIDTLSKTYTHIHLANSLLLLGNTFVFVQLVKAFVESTHRNRFLLIITWLMLTGVVITLMMYQLPDSGLLTGGLGFCLLSQFILLAYADRSITESINSSIFRSNLSLFRQLSPVYAAFLNNPKSRSAFGLGILLKIGFLSCTGLPFMKSFPMSTFFEMSYVAPLILFTYVANNTWGFYPALWVNSTLGKRSNSYRIYFQLLALPILLDLIATIGVMLYLGKVDAELLTFYALSTIALSINGLIFSLYKAFYVQSSFNFGQMKNNVNAWSILTAAVLLGLTMLAQKTVLTTLLFGIILLSGIWYLLRKVLSNHADNTHTLYEQLFTNRN